MLEYVKKYNFAYLGENESAGWKMSVQDGNYFKKSVNLHAGLLGT